MEHRKIRHSLAEYKDCKDPEGRKLISFTIRTTDGTDETYASRRAESKGASMTEELIRFSIVSYEVELSSGEIKNEIVKHPFESFDNWSTKARNFVVAAWKRLATPDERELESFFAAATDAE